MCKLRTSSLGQKGLHLKCRSWWGQHLGLCTMSLRPPKWQVAWLECFWVFEKAHCPRTEKWIAVCGLGVFRFQRRRRKSKNNVTTCKRVFWLRCNIAGEHYKFIQPPQTSPQSTFWWSDTQWKAEKCWPTFSLKVQCVKCVFIYDFCTGKSLTYISTLPRSVHTQHNKSTLVFTPLQWFSYTTLAGGYIRWPSVKDTPLYSDTWRRGTE